MEHDDTYIFGEWKTDISTRGQFILSKVADSRDLRFEAVLKMVFESQPQVIRSITQEYDTRNFPIEPFCIRDKDLEELNRIFVEYANKARELEDASTRAITPSPSISVVGVDGEIIVVSDAAEFSASRLPYSLKSIRFSNHTQAGIPTNGVVINIVNVNGTDPQNTQSTISIYGLDKQWVSGLYDRLKQFFNRRKTKRLWIHKIKTGDIILYFFIIPISILIIYRIDNFIPMQLHNLKVFGDIRLAGIVTFIYLYVGLLYGFNWILSYSRRTFPMYEIQLSTPNRSQTRRKIILGVSLSLAATIIFECIRFIVNSLL